MKSTGGTVLMLFLPALTIVVLSAVFWFRGRDLALDTFVGDVTKPTEGVTPEVAGTVIDERVEGRDIVAAAVGLEQAGFLRMEFRPESDGRPRAVTVHAVKPPTALSGGRVRVVELLSKSVQSPTSRTFSFETAAGRGESAETENAIYSDAVKTGFFRANPKAERALYVLLGTLFFCAGALALALTAVSTRMVAWTLLYFVAPFTLAMPAMVSQKLLVRLAFAGAAVVLLFSGLVFILPNLEDAGFTWPAKVGWGLAAASVFFFRKLPGFPRDYAAEESAGPDRGRQAAPL